MLRKSTAYRDFAPTARDSCWSSLGTHISCLWRLMYVEMCGGSSRTACRFGVVNFIFRLPTAEDPSSERKHMAKPTASNASGYATITLHSHLPYVINHGTWPHGLEWLSEAAAETYLPLLRVIGELEREGIYL